MRQLLLKDASWPLATKWEAFCVDDTRASSKAASGDSVYNTTLGSESDVLRLLQDVNTGVTFTLAQYAKRALVEMLVAWRRPLRQLMDADTLRYAVHLLLTRSTSNATTVSGGDDDGPEGGAAVSSSTTLQPIAMVGGGVGAGRLRALLSSDAGDDAAFVADALLREVMLVFANQVAPGVASTGLLNLVRIGVGGCLTSGV